MKTIYGLCDTRNGVIRYVGQTKLKLNERLQLWKSNARREVSDRPVSVWIRALPVGVLDIVQLEVAVDFNEAERRWIAALNNLLNVATGGPGCTGFFPNKATRQKRANSVRKNWETQTVRIRWVATEEQHKKQIDGCRKRTSRPMLGKKHSPETLEKMRLAWVLRKETENVKASP